jgi:D-alanyl-D-alanine carboxypeptidase/D-alanyl-D-alanine-endopeptidase (penicillin-binding protein 4)
MLCLGLLAAAVGPRADAKSKEPEPAAAPAPNPQPPPATETEAATTGKNGPRPLMGLAPRPSASAELPKPPRDPVERRAWLDAQLDAVFRTPALAKAKVSAIVIEADSGKTLYAHDDKTPLNAASNVKIVTSAASLSLLGPEYRWRTTLAVVGPPGGPPLPVGGEVSGDLYLRGSGDPTLSTENIAAMVSDLASLGLHKVKGSLVIDDSLFDGGYVPPAYDQKNDSTASRAPSSAASLDGNVVGVTIIPATAAGAPARIVVDPASH